MKPAMWISLGFLVALNLVSTCAAKLENGGLYRITYQGPGTCQGRYLTYDKGAKSSVENATLNIETSKNAALWRLYLHESNTVSLQTAEHGAGANLKLSKSLGCSPTIKLSKNNAFRWTVKPIGRETSVYSLEAAASRSCSKGRTTTLAASSTVCKKSNAVALLPSIKGSGWKFVKVASELPTAVVNPAEIPKVVTKFILELANGTTCSSLGAAQRQAIPDSLCATQIEYVISQGWSADKVVCGGEASCDNPQRRLLSLLQRRSLLLDDTSVTAGTTLTFPGTTQAELSLVNSLASSTAQNNDNPETFQSSVPGAQVASTAPPSVSSPSVSPSPTSSTTSSPSPEDPASPSPNPSPSPSDSPQRPTSLAQRPRD